MSQTKAQLLEGKAANIEFSAGTAALPAITFTGDVNTGIYSPAADTIAFAEGGVEAMRIDGSSRLLVGTSTAPASVRCVMQGNSSGNADEPAVVILAANTSTPTGGIGILRFSDNAYGYSAEVGSYRDGGTWSGSSKPTRLVFSTTADGASSPTERMRIGNTGAFSTFCASGSQSITARTAEGAAINNSLFIGRHSATSTTDGTASFLVYTNGNVLNTNNSYGSISDSKLKENIVDANSQWDDLKALQVRNYNFKEGQTHTQIGLIAQEVELVSPGLVSESPDRDEEGNDLGTVTKSVNYSVLYMKAVKALQEAMERIEQLESEMAAVKAQLS